MIITGRTRRTFGYPAEGIRAVLNRANVVALSFALFVAHAPKLSAANCDTSLQPVSDPDGYRERDGDRCEGLYISPVSSTSLEIVSLTVGGIPQAKTAAGPDLLLWVPSAWKDSGSVHIRAVGIPIGLYYRMDSELRPGVRLRWPVGAILSSQNIPFNEIGVFAFIHDSAGEPVYLPVALGEVVDAKAKVIVALRSASVIEDFVWRFLMAGEASPAKWQSAQTAGDRVVVTLPVDVLGGRGLLEVAWNSWATGQRQRTQFEIKY